MNTVGAHTFTVATSDKAGNSNIKKLTFTVEGRAVSLPKVKDCGNKNYIPLGGMQDDNKTNCF